MRGSAADKCLKADYQQTTLRKAERARERGWDRETNRQTHAPR